MVKLTRIHQVCHEIDEDKQEYNTWYSTTGKILKFGSYIALNLKGDVIGEDEEEGDGDYGWE